MFDVDIFGNDFIKLLYLFSSCIRIKCDVRQTDRQTDNTVDYDNDKLT